MVLKSKNTKLKYFLLLLLFAAMSYFSLVGVYRLASDRSSFLTPGIFSGRLYLLVALLLLINYAADASRFYYILKAMNVDVSWRQIVTLTFINYFTSNVTPFAVGGSVAQIYFLNREGVPVGAATAGTTIKTVLPILFYLVAAPVILVFDQSLDRVLPGRDSYLYMAFILALMTLGGVLAYKLLRNPDGFISGLSRLIGRFRRNKEVGSPALLDRFRKEVKMFQTHFSIYFSGSRRYVFLSAVLNLLFVFTLLLFPVLLIRDLNPAVPAEEIILSQIVITFVLYFAPTPGSAGFAEAAFTLLFSDYVSKNELVSLTFLWRLFTMYVGVMIGMAVFYVQLFRSGRGKGPGAGEKKGTTAEV